MLTYHGKDETAGELCRAASAVGSKGSLVRGANCAGS
jgi:hypothetical protein